MASDQQATNYTAQARAEVLQEAIACVTRDRNNSYGSPEDNFAAIAALWAIWDKYVLPGKYPPEHDVSMKMVLLKIGRIMTGTPGVRDNYVDGPGYFATAWGEIQRRMTADAPSPAATIADKLSETLRKVSHDRPVVNGRPVHSADHPARLE